MICYRDQSFCCNPACTGQCSHRFTAEVLAGARQWWGDDDPPIAFMDLCGADGHCSPVTDFEGAWKKLLANPPS